MESWWGFLRYRGENQIVIFTPWLRPQPLRARLITSCSSNRWDFHHWVTDGVTEHQTDRRGDILYQLNFRCTFTRLLVETMDLFTAS